jgi:hypothetical protein
MFENIGVVAGVEGVTVIHGSSWKAAEFIKPDRVWQTARAPITHTLKSKAKKTPVKPLQNRG